MLPTAQASLGEMTLMPATDPTGTAADTDRQTAPSKCSKAPPPTAQMSSDPLPAMAVGTAVDGGALRDHPDPFQYIRIGAAWL